jgi:hypothetical protein
MSDQNTQKATMHCEHDFPFWHYTDEDGMGGCTNAKVIELTKIGWCPRGGEGGHADLPDPEGLDIFGECGSKWTHWAYLSDWRDDE